MLATIVGRCVCPPVFLLGCMLEGDQPSGLGEGIMSTGNDTGTGLGLSLGSLEQRHEHEHMLAVSRSKASEEQPG